MGRTTAVVDIMAIESPVPADPVLAKRNSRTGDTANEIRSSEDLCRAGLEFPSIAAVGRLPLAPKTPQACFDLMLRVPYEGRGVATVRRLKGQASEADAPGSYPVERYLILNACLVALSRLADMPVPDSLKRQFCGTCKEIASTPERPDERLAFDGAAFVELAQVATLRRLHAGQCTFDVMRRIPIGWSLKVHPLDLPRFVTTLWSNMGGVGPVVEPHINYWRASQMILLKREHCRSIWRLAQFIEVRPEIRGLVSSSWLYGRETAQESPHLAWLREFYATENAEIFDAGPALVDAGFLVGNERRRQQYESGAFRPRETIVLWARADILAWARRHPEFADDAEGRATAAASKRECGAAEQSPARHWRSGESTLIDGRRLLYYHPRAYMALALVLPASLGAALAAAASSVAAGALALVVLVVCLWLFQYFCLQ